jgi:Predicted metal-binding protein (DUF2284)
MDFLALLKSVGFEKAELVGETGFNSTPKTKGVLFRAEKPGTSVNKLKPADEIEHYGEKMPVASGKRTIPNIEAVIEKAYALGCEKAKVIDTRTVIIEKWVRWKCLYGCPFYNRDGYHPPLAPGVEETKEMLSEYTKAILLNGPKGMELTDTAVRLEGEAYKMGFYKAFALTALPSGSGGESKPGAT